MSDTLNTNLNELGAWAGSDLEKTIKANIGVGSDAGLPSNVRFVSGVAKLILRRKAHADAKDDPEDSAVFLLQPKAKSASDQTPKFEPMLDNGRTKVLGRLWFVSASPSAGRYLDVEGLSDEKLFSLVTETLHLGDVPAVIYDPRAALPVIRFYSKGLNVPDQYEALEFLSPKITLDQICKAINQIHESCLITPDAQGRGGKLWKNKSKWHPVKNAEDVVQVYVRAGLTTAFLNCHIRHEQPGRTGRFDLSIEEPQLDNIGQTTVHAILELKILRSFWESGDPLSSQEILDWVEEGVRQAALYRDERNAGMGILCCFDMRKEHTGEGCFEHVREMADRVAVQLRVWFLFASSKLYRKFIINDPRGAFGS